MIYVSAVWKFDISERFPPFLGILASSKCMAKCMGMKIVTELEQQHTEKHTDTQSERTKRLYSVKLLVFADVFSNMRNVLIRVIELIVERARASSRTSHSVTGHYLLIVNFTACERALGFHYIGFHMLLLFCIEIENPKNHYLRSANAHTHINLSHRVT